MGGADVGDHGHVGLGATAQPLDFTEAPHPHLHHQGTGGGIGLQQGERGPHIVVFVAAAGHHRPQAGQGGADQFAGGGLAGRTRHGHHRHTQLAAPEAAEFLIGQQRVVHKPHGPAEGNHGLKLLGAQAVALGHGGGGPAGQGRLQKAMAIKPLPHQRHEQGTVQVGAAVGAHGSHAGGTPAWLTEGLAPERQQGIQGQGHGGVESASSRIMPEPTRAGRASRRPAGSTNSRRS